MLAALVACPADDASPAAAEPQLPLVEVALAQGGGLPDTRALLGEVRAVQRAELAAGAEGEVLEVTVREGDHVEAGAVVVRIDASLADADVASARAARREVRRELEQARRDRKRARQLADILPAYEIEQDVTRADTLRSRMGRLSAEQHRAEAQLLRHEIEAPFAGRVSARWVEPGDWVRQGDAIVELVEPSRVELLVEAPVDLFESVDVGAVAVVSTRDRPERKATAEVVGVVPALDPRTRTAAIRLVPRDAPTWLIPGDAVEVGFAIVHDEPGVIVPRNALVRGVVGVRVVKIVDGQAEHVGVEVVATADARALVRGENLEPDDWVVVRGNERLRPRQSVAVVPPAAAETVDPAPTLAGHSTVRLPEG